jgi:putative ABC transport system substrate-binding protein
MRRREFITLLGGAAAAWPLAARAQQAGMPVVGFLDARSPDAVRDRLRGFRQGLKDFGYVEGDNLTIVYRWAENHVERLPELATELVRRQVAVIATAGDHVAPVAKTATATIPVVFIVAQDPVRLGLVASFARPGGNVTGVNFFNGELSAKRLGLLRELIPGATRIAILVNPTNNPLSIESTVRDVETAGRVLGLQIQVLSASTSQEINAAFATLVRDRYDGLVVDTDPFFSSRLVQLANLAVRHGVPAIYAGREFPAAGGLMSYGSSIVEAWRQSGVYVGRILKGAKPADLPVTQPTKFELVINAETARMLGLAVPPTLLATADEVIE